MLLVKIKLLSSQRVINTGFPYKAHLISSCIHVNRMYSHYPSFFVLILLKALQCMYFIHVLKRVLLVWP